jgi:hypothetical protein
VYYPGRVLLLELVRIRRHPDRDQICVARVVHSAVRHYFIELAHWTELNSNHAAAYHRRILFDSVREAHIVNHQDRVRMIPNRRKATDLMNKATGFRYIHLPVVWIVDYSLYIVCCTWARGSTSSTHSMLNTGAFRGLALASNPGRYPPPDMGNTLEPVMFTMVIIVCSLLNGWITGTHLAPGRLFSFYNNLDSAKYHTCLSIFDRIKSPIVSFWCTLAYNVFIVHFLYKRPVCEL